MQKKCKVKPRVEHHIWKIDFSLTFFEKGSTDLAFANTVQHQHLHLHYTVSMTLNFPRLADANSSATRCGLLETLLEKHSVEDQ